MTKFIPGGPERFAHQKRALHRMIDTRGVTALIMDPGTGKALDIDTPVPTPSGWTTMGELQTGDLVYAPDGSTTRIIAHDPYEADTYRLWFSGGAEVVADGDHLWTVETRTTGNRWLPETVRSTRELIDTLEVDGKRAHLVRMTAPVEDVSGGQDGPLPLDPYTLGVWLGDGRAEAGVLTLGEKDHEHIVSELINRGQYPRVTRVSRGCAYVTLGADPSRCRYGHEGRGRNCAECAHGYYRRERYGEDMTPVNRPVVEVLRELGVLGSKHVPAAYLRAPVADRLALLRGLVDTDGYREGRAVEVTFSSRTLAENVHELACSLGERATLREGRATLDGEDYGPKWRVRWTPRLHDPATLPRRQVEPHPNSSRLRGRYLEGYEYAGRRWVRCLTVESSTDQYLVTRDWIPTHNTATTLDYLSLLALKNGEDRETRVLIIAPLAAVDTWVLQAKTFVSEQVNFWAEVLGGSILEKGEALAARGGNLFKTRLGKPNTLPVQKLGVHPRALHGEKSQIHDSRPEVDPKRGPGAVPGPRLILTIVNIDTFSQRRAVGRHVLTDLVIEAVRRYDPEVIVIDESHKIKSPSSNVSRAADRLSSLAPRRLILTGTIMPASPMDVFAQWRFLEPTAFGQTRADGTKPKATFGGFKARYAQLGGWMGKEVVGYHRLDEMQEIMAKNAVVVRKKDALDLPQTTDALLPVHLTAHEKRAYNEMKKDLAVKIAANTWASSTNALTQMMRLRQITSGHLPDDDGTMQVIGKSKVKAISSLIHDTLAGEKRIVVFALFSQEIDMLHKELEQKNTEVMVIRGSTPQAKRLELRQRFGSDDPTRIVLVAQIKTLSLAVNELVTANHAIFASLSQQRDDYIQARDRLNRLGQSRPVTFWHAVAPGTIDEIILQAHDERTNLESAMLTHIQKGQDL